MRNYLLFCLVALFWGGSFVAIKVAISELPPSVCAWIRIAIAASFFAIVGKLQGKSLAVPKALKFHIWLTGIFAIGLPFAAIFWGEQFISAGLAGIINGTVPIWTFLLGILFARQLEAFSIGKFIGLLMGLAGVSLIFYPRMEWGQAGSSELSGVIALLVMALSYGVGTLMNRWTFVHYPKQGMLANVFHQSLASLVFVGVFIFISGDFQKILPDQITSATVGALAYLGLCSTAIAYLIFYHLIREWGAVRGAAITYVVPAVAVALDYLFNGAVPRNNEIFGALIVLTAIFVIQSSKGKTKPIVKNEDKRAPVFAKSS